MNNSARIIEKANATMSMENMPLLDSDSKHILECMISIIAIRIPLYLKNKLNIIYVVELKATKHEIISLYSSNYGE